MAGSGIRVREDTGDDSDSSRNSAGAGSGNSSGLPVQPGMGLLPKRHARNDSANHSDPVLTPLRLKCRNQNALR